MLDHDVPRRGTVLAFDFGEKRIGVAVGEWELRQAHPLTAIVGEANRERFAAIAALIDEWRPLSLVVGLPLATDGSAHAMTARCTRFANQLRGRFGLPVAHVDERYSSVEAEERLREPGSRSHRGARRGQDAKAQIDALAAQIILQSYFDGQAGPATPDPVIPQCHQEPSCP
jgi:putative Holliday junction resolvase